MFSNCQSFFFLKTWKQQSFRFSSHFHSLSTETFNLFDLINYYLSLISKTSFCFVLHFNWKLFFFTIFCVYVWMNVFLLFLCVCVFQSLLENFFYVFFYLQHSLILKWAIKALDFRLFKFIQSAGVVLWLVVILSEVVRCTCRTAVSVVIHYDHGLAKVLWSIWLQHLRGEIGRICYEIDNWRFSYFVYLSR